MKLLFASLLCAVPLVSAGAETNMSCCATIPSRFEAPKGPEGMVFIPSGEFTMGWDGRFAREDEQPLHRVRLDGFWIKQTPVTNAEFKEFVDATGYVTTAEKKVDLEEIMKQLPPGSAPPPASQLEPASLVFTPPGYPVTLDNPTVWWLWKKGANWKQPNGPGSGIANIMDHPVVQVSWYDAKAYADWKGMSLPTEAQWEYAARGGHEQWLFGWGDEPIDKGKPKANTWDGTFPNKNTRRDGFYATSPVGSFPPNGYGLYDMAGNVWEWVNDWYHPGTYGMYPKGEVVENPRGPSGGYDPAEPHIAKRVNRGGSFLCSDAYCSGYRPAARMKTSPDTGLNHTGFRVVWNPPQPEK